MHYRLQSPNMLEISISLWAIKCRPNNVRLLFNKIFARCRIVKCEKCICFFDHRLAALRCSNYKQKARLVCIRFLFPTIVRRLQSFIRIAIRHHLFDIIVPSASLVYHPIILHCKHSPLFALLNLLHFGLEICFKVSCNLIPPLNAIRVSSFHQPQIPRKCNSLRN